MFYNLLRILSYNSSIIWMIHEVNHFSLTFLIDRSHMCLDLERQYNYAIFHWQDNHESNLPYVDQLHLVETNIFNGCQFLDTSTKYNIFTIFLIVSNQIEMTHRLSSLSSNVTANNFCRAKASHHRLNVFHWSKFGRLFMAWSDFSSF